MAGTKTTITAFGGRKTNLTKKNRGEKNKLSTRVKSATYMGGGQYSNQARGRAGYPIEKYCRDSIRLPKGGGGKNKKEESITAGEGRRGFRDCTRVKSRGKG